MERVTDRYADLRREYALGGLAESDVSPDPFTMFQGWYHDAVAAAIYEPNAMVVATTSDDGRPSARLVLLKGFSPEGWVFFTNLGSRKGTELTANPRVSLLFPWHPLERQVRVDGTAVRLAGREFELAAKLASDPHRVFTKTELLRDVWGIRTTGIRTRTLDSHASRLRRKLEAAGATDVVVNQWGVGYRLLE